MHGHVWSDRLFVVCMDQVVFSLGEARNKAGSESKSEESIKESHLCWTGLYGREPNWGG